MENLPKRLRCVVSRRAPRELPAPGTWRRKRDRRRGPPGLRSSAGRRAAGVGAPRQRPNGARAAGKCRREPGAPAPAARPAASQLRVLACRVRPSRPGECVQMLTQLPQGIPLGD
ncbi:Slit And Ntrk-Like Protein 1 [Manis pentadactyla]|nr:Slit And Ntrk-Like Protein 1 [Manis pentadactyla]